MLVLVPDNQVEEADIERAALGPGADLRLFRCQRGESVPDALWRECDGIVMWHEFRLTAALVARLQRCRIVVRCGVGYDNIDVAACTRHGIPVCNVPNYGTTEVADHAIALLLALTRGLFPYQERLRADPVVGFRYDAVPVVRRIRGRRLGIVGLGRIGTAVARRALALDMAVAFFDPHVGEGWDLALGLARCDSLEALLATVDAVSLHVPLTPETRGMIGSKTLAAMKRDAILINTARGAVVDLDALHACLQQRHLAAAALDVLPSEPPDPRHPLIVAWREGADWLRHRLLLTPHAAFYSEDGFRDLRRLGAETAALWLGAGRLRNNVNPEFRHQAPIGR
ncbi:MAG: C-terminal binding protein [Alphaproteobacteria bacterium]|nr:C-terminal binding protein [Alphaproteobacteria bacterium]